MITKRQLKALGYKNAKEVPVELWNPNINDLFAKCGKENFNGYDDGQTYHEFIDIGERPPNEQGTGRYKFQQIQGIDVIIIPKKNSKRLSSQTIQRLLYIISAFTTLQAKFKKSNLVLSPKGIINTKDQLQFQMEQSEDHLLQVQPLLSLLIQLKHPNRQTIALVERQICEDSQPLQGRACGDGVAAISFEGKLVERSGGLEGICWTVIHQTLHTLGFDHCLAWKCLMNGVDDGEMWLCPACIRKLGSQIEGGVLAWIQRMTQAYEKMGMKKGADKGRKLLQGIKASS